LDSLHHAASALLGRIRIVLVSPSHGGNVGAAARAMRVMGLRRLSLVSPRFADICAHPEAIAFASGATEVLAGAQVHESLDAALADCHLAVAVSAESREFSAAPQPPWAVCPALLRALEDDEALEVAMVFGTERTGLSIEQVGRCALGVLDSG